MTGRATPSVYALMNREAKAWWWHAELRKQGKAVEARALERENIKRMVATVRGAWLFKRTGSGFTVECLHHNGRSSLRGYGDGEAYSAALRRCRWVITQVDLRTIPEHRRTIVALCGPMPGDPRHIDAAEPARMLRRQQGDSPTYGAFDYMPLPEWLALVEAVGATVHWGVYAPNKHIAYVLAQPTIEALFPDQPGDIQERMQAVLQDRIRVVGVHGAHGATSLRAQED